MPITNMAVCFCLVALAFPAFASGDTQTPSFPGGIGALIMWYVCASRRKKEIGGWLLYYYIQLYIGIIFTVVMTAVSFKNYLPSTWMAAPNLYPLFLVTTVPALLLTVAQFVVAEKLRKSRNYNFVRILKYVLWGDLAISILGVAIDSGYFRDSLVFDALALIWPTIWLPYFYFSKRVKRVFDTKDWLPSLSDAAA